VNRAKLADVRVAAFAVVVAAITACHSSEAPTTPSAAADPVARVDRVARACAKITSCAHPHDAAKERDPSACVDAWLANDDDPTLLACVGTAKSCADVDACQSSHAGDRAASAYCRAHRGEQTACDGNRLVTCSDDDFAESTSVDCSTFGATCGEIHGEGGLVAHGCASPTLCPVGAPEARCDGTGAIVTCRDGAAEKTACSAGVRCLETRAGDGSQSAMCDARDHVHCTTVGASRCDANHLMTCVPHGTLGEARVVDCADAGLVCSATGDHATCAFPGARSCTGTAARCDGDALSFCAAGRPVKVSCAQIGFERCDPDGEALQAACAPGAKTRVSVAPAPGPRP
jgi:hypothetical protein